MRQFVAWWRNAKRRAVERQTLDFGWVLYIIDFLPISGFV